METYKNYPILNNGRINFSKISGNLEVPYLVEIQTDSYKSFLTDGIKEALEDAFPIANPSKTLTVHYVKHELGKCEISPTECKQRNLTYAAPLTVTLRLYDSATQQYTESDVFMGTIPLMTDSGTFIFNGSEKVIVSQIVRSPGAYLSKSFDCAIYLALLTGFSPLAAASAA